MPSSPIHIVFAGGGTGGHLFAGLAVARQLAAAVPQLRITFAGSNKQFEKRHTRAAGFDHIALPCRPLPQRVGGVLPFLASSLAGFRAARRLIGREQVRAVVGLGGYASVPAAYAAIRRGLPLVLLEQNAVPGRATRWLAKSADVVCAAFAESRSGLPGRCPLVVTGNPIRPEFKGPTEKTSDRNPSGRQLVVLGGSGGARSLNENVPPALERIRGRLADWQIVHQSGESGFEATRRRYATTGLSVRVVPFLADMPAVLGQSDLAVCRSGGTTLAELAVCGVPAILLPYPQAVDDHQRSNADVFTASGAALTLDQRELPDALEGHLARALANLLADRPRRRRMSLAMHRLARPRAAGEVAAVIRLVAGGHCRFQPAAA